MELLPCHRPFSRNMCNPGYYMSLLDKFQDTREPLPASFFNQDKLSKLEACRQRDATMSYKLAAGKYVVVPYTVEREKEPSYLLQIFLRSKDAAIELGSVESIKEPKPQPCENVIRLSANKEDETYKSVFKHYATKEVIMKSRSLQKCLNEVFIKEFPNPNGFKFTIDGSRGLLASMDHAGRGALEMENFCRLWRYLTQFKDIFADIDSNRCGFLNSVELRKAVNRTGLNISKHLLNRMIARFGDSEDKLNFVDYLLCMVRLKTVSKTFFMLSDDGKGVYINQEKFMALMV